MSTGQFTNNGITVRVSGTSHQGAADRLQLVPASSAPTTPGLALVPSPAAVGGTCKALFGAARCGEPTEEGEGNPDGYCTHHLDLMAGDQEDWESDQEYARRRRHLCPHQTGSGMPWIEWCPEPSHPESDDGFCLIHEPTLNPDDLAYDAEAALPYLDDSVPCLQCRGVPGCEMCAGTGRITLRRANWHRGDDTLPPPDDTAGADVNTDQTVDTTPPTPTSHAQTLRERGLTLDVCPGCRAEPGQPHGDDCDHACCPDCGEQLIYHDCEHWSADADGPDRAALWHGINPRAEVAQTLNWWTTAAGIDHLVEDYTRVLYAIYAKNAFVTWDPHAQRYQIDQAAAAAAQAEATPDAGA